MKTFEVFLLIDEDGDYATGHDRDSAVEAYENNIGSLDGSLTHRIVQINVTASLPVPAVVAITVPDEALPTVQASGN